MKLVIPDELFNSRKVPEGSGNMATVRIADYIRVLLLRLPSCTSIMIERAFWNTVCDFCLRTGALIERKTDTVSSGNKNLVLTEPTYGEFQRFVGAGLGGNPVSVSDISVAMTSTYPKVTFNTVSESTTAYADYSVVPNINANHDSTPSGSGSAITYPNDKWILPKWFLAKYDTALIAGTNFGIFSMVGRRWTDFNAAKTNAFAYNREINRVATGMITSGMRKRISVGIETPFLGVAQQPTTVPTAES